MGLIDVFRVIFVFLIFVIGSIFFNAVSVKSAFTMLGQIFSFAKGASSPNQETLLLFLLAGMFLNGVQKIQKWPVLSNRAAFSILFLYGFAIVFVLGKFAPGGKDFLYFQF